MTARYAIYYVPAADDPLMVAANRWLGRDPYSGQSCQRPASPDLADLDLDALVADPRRYGFHATLKAPFELADGASEMQLVDALGAYASRRPGFSAVLRVRAMRVFLALVLDQPSSDMQSLHEDCVRRFEPFRAPLSDYDYNRRLRPGMSPSQMQQLKEYGYPGIFADFRFHMTLTGAIGDESLRERLLIHLRARFGTYETSHWFGGLAVLKQRDRSADFHVLARTSFAG